MSNYIYCAVAAGLTYYKLTQHKDGTITVRAPYTEWRDNVAHLVFRRHKISAEKRVSIILYMFKNNLLYYQREELTMKDLLNWYEREWITSSVPDDN